jgi:hypothetical protein
MKASLLKVRYVYLVLEKNFSTVLTHSLFLLLISLFHYLVNSPFPHGHLKILTKYYCNPKLPEKSTTS